MINYQEELVKLINFNDFERKPDNKKEETRQMGNPVHIAIEGFGMETEFAIRRLLDKNNIIPTDITINGIFGPMSLTYHSSLNKKGIIHRSISGQWEVSINKWNINKIQLKTEATSSELILDSRSKHKLFVKELYAEMQAESVLRGSSFSISNKGIEFFNGHKQAPIFSTNLQDCMEYSIYAPIRYHSKTPIGGFRRGVLLAGTYGTGKSLTAAHTAYLATEAGLTFVYVSDPKNFSKASRMLSSLGKVVLFCEDVDRVFEDERDDEVDSMLNSMDGVDSKNEDVLHIFTTNNLDIIERAFLRPGRIDSIVEMELPNEEATRAILNRYLGMESEGMISQFQALTPLRYTPAVLREICIRAKLAARKDGSHQVSLGDLNSAEMSIRKQVALIESTRKPKDEDYFSLAIKKAVGPLL